MKQRAAETSDEHAGAQEVPGARRSSAIGKGIVLILILAAIASPAVFDVRALLRAALSGMEQLGLWGQILFVLVYAISTVLLIPGSALGLGAGALFGVVRGSVLVSIGSTVGATLAFLLGRYLARGWVAKRIEGRAAFAAIDHAVAGEGWKIVLLTRLSPVFPFTLLNYAFGLTRVSLRDYVLASWLGMMPGTLMYVYLGSLASAGAGDRQRTPGEWALYAVGLLATMAVVVIVMRVARRALAKRDMAVP